MKSNNVTAVRSVHCSFIQRGCRGCFPSWIRGRCPKTMSPSPSPSVGTTAKTSIYEKESVARRRRREFQFFLQCSNGHACFRFDFQWFSSLKRKNPNGNLKISLKKLKMWKVVLKKLIFQTPPPHPYGGNSASGVQPLTLYKPYGFTLPNAAMPEKIRFGRNISVVKHIF